MIGLPGGGRSTPSGARQKLEAPKNDVGLDTLGGYMINLSGSRKWKSRIMALRESRMEIPNKNRVTTSTASARARIRLVNLLSCLLLAALVPMVGHRDVQAPQSQTLIIKTLSGGTLGSFFESLQPSPINSLNRIRNPQQTPCALTAPKLISFPGLIEGIVRAQSLCYTTPCSGSHWETSYDWCTGMACFGTREISSWNPNAPECNGICQNGQHCGSGPACGCESPVCNSCDPYGTCG